jgi:hypothetical protein
MHRVLQYTAWCHKAEMKQGAQLTFCWRAFLSWMIGLGLISVWESILLQLLWHLVAVACGPARQ